MNLTLKGLSLIFCLCYSLNLWASSSKCEGQFIPLVQGDAEAGLQPVARANTTLELIEFASQLEAHLKEQLSNQRNVEALTLAAERLVSLEELIQQILNESKPLDELNQIFMSLNEQSDGEVIVNSTIEPKLGEELSFLKLNPGSEVSVADSHGKSYVVTFNESFLKDIKSPRISPRARKKLWTALNHGVVDTALGRAGIKVMHTWEGIQFVEVKTLGGEAGAFRIFGCMKGNQIQLYFLGHDMTSASDPQRDRIKSLCK